MNKIAYIVSLKGGFEAFVYPEIKELKKLGCDISIFTPKYKKGPYMPPEDWDVYKVKKISTVLNQPRYFLNNVRLYLKLLKEALVSGSVVEFLISMNFADIMRKKNITHIHCHMGDRKLFISF